MVTIKALRGLQGVAASATPALAILKTAAAGDFGGSSYARNLSFDANMSLFWTIDRDLETIRVAFHARVTSGWVDLGVSRMGGVEGVDIVFNE